MVLQLAEAVDLDRAKIRFTYSCSDPDAVTRSETEPYVYDVPADKHLRIWTVNGNVERNKAEVGAAGGHFVKSGSEYRGPDLGSGRTILLYVEGVRASASKGDLRILVELDPDGDGPGGWLCQDAVRCSVIGADVDVDSDNDNEFDPPDGDLLEDQYEDIADDGDNPGKLVAVNSDDKDDDGIPDFADGYDRDGISGNADDSNPGETFVPIVFQLPAPIDVARARVRVSYDASDPAEVKFNAGGQLVPPPTGSLRIWKRKESESRNKEAIPSGDFIGTNEYAAVDFGFSGEQRSVTMYVEALRESEDVADKRIVFEVMPDDTVPATGFLATDAVRLTAYELKIKWCRIGSVIEQDVAGPLPPEAVEPFDGTPGTPGGQGGFGGPPVDSGFKMFLDPFVIRDLALQPGDGAPGTMALRLVSNVADWDTEYALTETQVGSKVFVDATDSLAIQLLDTMARTDTARARMNLLVASMAFGARRSMTVYELTADSGVYESEHVAITATMTALPTPAGADAMAFSVVSSFDPENPVTDTLTETGPDTREFSNGDGSLVFALTRLADGGTTKPSDLTGVVRSTALGLAGTGVDAIETETGSLTFTTVALHNQGDPGQGPGALAGLAIGQQWRPMPRIRKNLVQRIPWLGPRIFGPSGEMRAAISRKRGNDWVPVNASGQTELPVYWVKDKEKEDGDYVYYRLVNEDKETEAPVLLEADTGAPVPPFEARGQTLVARVQPGDLLRARPWGEQHPREDLKILWVNCDVHKSAVFDPRGCGVRPLLVIMG